MNKPPYSEIRCITTYLILAPAPLIGGPASLPARVGYSPVVGRYQHSCAPDLADLIILDELLEGFTFDGVPLPHEYRLGFGVAHDFSVPW